MNTTQRQLSTSSMLAVQACTDPGKVDLCQKLINRVPPKMSGYDVHDHHHENDEDDVDSNDQSMPNFWGSNVKPESNLRVSLTRTGETNL